MTTYITDFWQYGSSASEIFTGDRYGVARNDVFQLSGSESGTAGGVSGGWDSFYGGEGSDRVYISVKSGYVWTAMLIADNGLNGVETIDFHPGNSLKSIFFQGDVDFSDVTSMTSGTKIYGRGNDNTFNGGILGEYVEGDGGNDTLFGNGGNDALHGDSTSSNHGS